MNKQEDLLATIFKSQIQNSIKDVVKEIFKEQPFYVQEFISTDEVIKRYGLSASSIRNYHRQGVITLRRVLVEKRSRLFISVVELEKHLKNNPLPRNAA